MTWFYETVKLRTAHALADGQTVAACGLALDASKSIAPRGRRFFLCKAYLDTGALAPLGHRTRPAKMAH